MSICNGVKEAARVLGLLRLQQLFRCMTCILQGFSCNVSKPSDVTALAGYAKDQLGGIDIW